MYVCSSRFYHSQIYIARKGFCKKTNRIIRFFQKKIRLILAVTTAKQYFHKSLSYKLQYELYLVFKGVKCRSSYFFALWHLFSGMVDTLSNLLLFALLSLTLMVQYLLTY